MLDPEDAPPPRRDRLVPLPLSPLGVAELAAYIVELKAEIRRVEEEIGSKNAHREAAAAMFQPPK